MSCKTNRYCIILADDMTPEEREVYIQLFKYADYTTGIAGYTIKQIVDNSYYKFELTTQKVRTILKKFEKAGYIEFLTSGSKGKESTLKLTLKQQLFNNNAPNKNEQLQQVEGDSQQQSNNNLTTLSKKKEKNNIYSEVIDYLNIKANTNYKHSTKSTQTVINARVGEGFNIADFKKVIDNKVDQWKDTDFEKYLRPQTLFGTKFESYLNENKKTPAETGTKVKANYNPNICNSSENYTVIGYNDFK